VLMAREPRGEPRVGRLSPYGYSDF
jgi:hypothetical protein